MSKKSMDYLFMPSHYFKRSSVATKFSNLRLEYEYDAAGKFVVKDKPVDLSKLVNSSADCDFRNIYESLVNGSVSVSDDVIGDYTGNVSKNDKLGMMLSLQDRNEAIKLKYKDYGFPQDTPWQDVPMVMNNLSKTIKRNMIKAGVMDVDGKLIVSTKPDPKPTEGGDN